MVRLADKIFRHTLFTPVGKHALDYLKNRGFQEQTLKRAGIGYAPPGYETVLKTAEARGITRKTLERHRWQRERTADALGIHRKTLFSKMKKHGLSMEGA